MILRDDFIALVVLGVWVFLSTFTILSYKVWFTHTCSVTTL